LSQGLTIVEMQWIWQNNQLVQRKEKIIALELRPRVLAAAEKIATVVGRDLSRHSFLLWVSRKIRVLLT
jgi:hypothetical protein